MFDAEMEQQAAPELQTLVVGEQSVDTPNVEAPVRAR
jgi:hypothetical protein